MSKQDLHKTLYATLVGRVDTSISELADIASQDPCDRQRVLAVAESLRQALLEAEDMYLDADESE